MAPPPPAATGAGGGGGGAGRGGRGGQAGGGGGGECGRVQHRDDTRKQIRQGLIISLVPRESASYPAQQMWTVLPTEWPGSPRIATHDSAFPFLKTAPFLAVLSTNTAFLPKNSAFPRGALNKHRLSSAETAPFLAVLQVDRVLPGGGPNQRDDAALSTLPTCHLFCCAIIHKEMMQPCPLYLHVISLVALIFRMSSRDDAALSALPACHLFGRG